MRVIDSIVYYNQNGRQSLKNVFCEIEISGHLCSIYGQLKEYERVRFYNLKGHLKHGNNFSFYDHETQKTYNQYLYLQTSRASMLNLCSMTGALKAEAGSFKEYVKEHYKNNLLLSSIDFKKPETAGFYRNEIKKMMNEIDVFGINLEYNPQKICGCLSNGHLFQILVRIS